ncbi:hypothetical protein HanRHA438_Chr02g0088891 [Helianthus annuus]|nr:hypothetical protein HanRHA438_Chr02g0088891 [Helianthus annuus]
MFIFYSCLFYLCFGFDQVWIPKQVISKYKLHFILLDIQFED